jgi:hypothetical protein
MSPAWLRPIRLLSITVAAVLATLGAPSGTEAGLVVEFRNITGGREGGTGSFEVVLVSSDPAVDIYDFGVQIEIAGTSVNFTGATTATTAPYLFSITGSDSLDDPATYPLGTILTNQSMLLADYTTLPFFQTVPYTDPNTPSTGEITEWALGLVLFRVPWDVTLGEYTLSVNVEASTITTYVDNGTNLTPVPLAFTSYPATILVVVPEATPSMLALSGLGVAGVGSVLARRRRARRARGAPGISPLIEGETVPG